MDDAAIRKLKEKLDPHKEADKEWYLSLLDGEGQLSYESKRLGDVLVLLKILYIAKYRRRIKEAEEEIALLRRGDHSAEDYRRILEKRAYIEAQEKEIEKYKCFFSEPYFARIDVVDGREGYNSYYIGKKGDVNLEIVDWRAPLAVRYYQKSRVNFRINEYDYRTVLRRALSVKNGRVLDFKNEYLSVRDVLSPEEIAGRDEEILFDPYLRKIIQSRKDDLHIRDIIRTIQEQQFEIIAKPERESFVVQGCAGSGKTMILLHRLSYLMYNNESLSPQDVLVITPSDSFNAFIDELSRVLELKKVRTITLRNYYCQALRNQGIDLDEKLRERRDAREPREYLEYLYSPAFSAELKKRVAKIYGEMRGFFTGAECREVAELLFADCKRKRELFARVKNAPVRIRRAVLGELKDGKEGGFYFTKPFRGLMGAYVQAEDFLTFVLREEERTPDYFFSQFSEFYKNLQRIVTEEERVFELAERDLDALSETIEREIADLKRYRIKRGEEEILTYAERIARREELLGEVAATGDILMEMRSDSALLGEFFAVLRSSKFCCELGKCKDAIGVSRWLYRETVKRAKERAGLSGLYPSDAYALCAMLNAAGRKLTPRYGLVFVDEGQDISQGEYELLFSIHDGAAFNVFGDLKQNITPERGIKNWRTLWENLYTINRNYRNTNEIVEFVSGMIDVEMEPIGLHGEEVKSISPRQVTGFFRDRTGLKALITREENLPMFEKRGYHRLDDGGLSQTKINVMTVFESKGLEFSVVAVYDRGMTDNERYIAYTRALRDLAVIKEK